MSITIQRRLEKLEYLVNQVANPEGPREIIMLAVPSADTSSEAKAAYEAQCRAAEERGATVIGLVGVRPQQVRSMENLGAVAAQKTGP